jgi:hypothetical protein
MSAAETRGTWATDENRGAGSQGLPALLLSRARCSERFVVHGWEDQGNPPMEKPFLPKIDEVCPSCKFGVGKPFHVLADKETTTVKLRCENCGQEWRVRISSIR